MFFLHAYPLFFWTGSAHVSSILRRDPDLKLEDKLFGFQLIYFILPPRLSDHTRVDKFIHRTTLQTNLTIQTSWLETHPSRMYPSVLLYNVHITFPPLFLLAVLFSHDIDDLMSTHRLQLYDGPGTRAAPLQKVMFLKTPSYCNFHHLNMHTWKIQEAYFPGWTDFDLERIACFNSYQGYIVASRSLSIILDYTQIPYCNEACQTSKCVLPLKTLSYHSPQVRNKIGPKEKPDDEEKHYESDISQDAIHVFHIFASKVFTINVTMTFHGPDTLYNDVGQLCQYGGLYIFMTENQNIKTEDKTVMNLCYEGKSHITYTKSHGAPIYVLFRTYQGYSSAKVHLLLQWSFELAHTSVLLEATCFESVRIPKLSERKDPDNFGYRLQDKGTVEIIPYNRPQFVTKGCNVTILVDAIGLVKVDLQARPMLFREPISDYTVTLTLISEDHVTGNLKTEIITSNSTSFSLERYSKDTKKLQLSFGSDWVAHFVRLSWTEYSAVCRFQIGSVTLETSRIPRVDTGSSLTLHDFVFRQSCQFILDRALDIYTFDIHPQDNQQQYTPGVITIETMGKLVYFLI